MPTMARQSERQKRGCRKPEGADQRVMWTPSGQAVGFEDHRANNSAGNYLRQDKEASGIQATKMR